MGGMRSLLVFLWLLQVYLAQAQVPLLASTKFCQFNPTQTTVALEKPFCFYSTTSATSVYLYVMMDSTTNTVLSTGNTYTSTNGGSTAPYVATTFPNPNCTNDPVLSQLNISSTVDSVLNSYVIRVGNDVSCFGTVVCNGPLQTGVAYRFKYVFYNVTLPIAVKLFESEWSSKITTKGGKLSTTLDAWPGRRSGGMIVITSILSVLTFLVLAGLIAAVVSNLMNPSSGIESKEHKSQTSHSKNDPVEYEREMPGEPGEH